MHPVFPGCGVIKKEPGGVSCPVLDKYTIMKQPTFHGKVLLPLSVFIDARAGNPLAMERILQYYDGYMNKLCTRRLYEFDGMPHVRMAEYMKHRLQNKLIGAVLKDSL